MTGLLKLLDLINMDVVYPASILFMPYLTFIFCAEQVNPFFRPNTPSRMLRLQFGKRMAFTMFLATVITNILLQLADTGPVVAFSVGGAFFVVVGLYLSIRRLILLKTLA